MFSASAQAADVFAHFMVQNSYAYDVSTWKNDMTSAQQVGIDGFALNWIPPYCSSTDPKHSLAWQASSIANAFAAAEQQNFKLFFSFDMSYGVGSNCPTGLAWNETYMSSIISNYTNSSAAYKWNNQMLVTTYAGEAYGNAFFQSLKQTLSEQDIDISIAPGFVTYAEAAQNEAAAGQANAFMSAFDSLDGFLNWQSWPLNKKLNNTADIDLALQTTLKAAGKKGPYIMTVSPWQFKDLDDGNPENSWVSYSDYLFNDRFHAAVTQVHPDIIELQTWNDWAESHYLRDLPASFASGPASADLGTMLAYVNGTDHAAWRLIADYYISWYKSGSAPAITQDQVVYWYRRHPKSASCSGGGSAVRNANLPTDAVFAWALVRDNATTVTMSAGANALWEFTASPAGGPKMGMVPFPSDLGDGILPEVSISRGGQTITGNASVLITQDCEYQDFNPVVGLVGPGEKVNAVAQKVIA
ncbi:MAG: hypothetical protein M1821_001685 [Bathelium mastoideum]|nr:MAG: hypothetical protein M1821_001685 [Bathelium mastoideum]